MAGTGNWTPLLAAFAISFGGALAYGMVAVNCVKITGHPVPFGGVEQSIGRQGRRRGLEEFTEIKYVCAAYRAA